jgi:hypothetical protein
MIRLILEKLGLQNPTWSSAILKVGEEVTMSVDAPDIADPQCIRFDILRGAELSTQSPGNRARRQRSGRRRTFMVSAR